MVALNSFRKIGQPGTNLFNSTFTKGLEYTEGGLCVFEQLIHLILCCCSAEPGDQTGVHGLQSGLPIVGQGGQGCAPFGQRIGLSQVHLQGILDDPVQKTSRQSQNQPPGRSLSFELTYILTLADINNM